MNGETDLVDDIVLTQMMLQLNPSLFSPTIPFKRGHADIVSDFRNGKNGVDNVVNG